MEKQLGLPLPYSDTMLAHGWAQWQEAATENPSGVLSAWIEETVNPKHECHALLAAVFGNSPYLTRLLLQHPEVMHELSRNGALHAHQAFLHSLRALNDAADLPSLMRGLRIAKGKLALLVALADIAGLWNLVQVTNALSGFAELSLTLSVEWLLKTAAKRGEITLAHPENPAEGSGIVVLGMGKLGGYELNYSSDIDLIVLFERDKLGYKGRHTEQHFMNKLTHDLVQIMQERTADGYVFRTDLRLRPDPASTPPAVNTDAAYYYYESVGQNWERAAMIKARPVAGDHAAGNAFLKGIAPFMWRRNLDFAAINDIHSIKRQMDGKRAKTIELKGHNIKLGLGGIREIEFYVQIHQLIWGGREAALRIRGTCETLLKLVELRLVEEDKEWVLHSAYEFLRALEHRLQMVADEQTHSLPDTDEEIAHIAAFMGFADSKSFSDALTVHLEAVHAIYASSFQSAEKLGDGGNLVFTGVSHDPETLKTLRAMGYQSPETISEMIMGWHHGSCRATRIKRSRELLTELMPVLLKRFSETANPDAALLRFNEFLGNLPAGVQLFSLFSANPHLLGLIADIMGSAPTLADSLSKSPALLEAVLYADFYDSLPSPAHLHAQLAEMLVTAHSFEQKMDTLRRFRSEKQFQAGVQFLKHMISAQQVGQFLSLLAEEMVSQTLAAVTEEFEKGYGRIPGARFAIIALGKLGSREMTFSSDIDMVFIYEVEDFDAVSDGEKSYTASVYYNRLAQRLLSAFTTVSTAGKLYDIDTRLRPSGKQGLLAISSQALWHYFEELAWTFEYMAFTKARAVAGDEALQESLDDFIAQQIYKERDLEKLRKEVHEMRDRTEKKFHTDDPWNLKYVRGGLMDIDFIAQYLMLRHAPDTPGGRSGSAAETFRWLKQTGRLQAESADALIAHDIFLGQLFHLLRLCSNNQFSEETALPALKKLLLQSVKEKSFEGLRERLIQVERNVHDLYISLLGNPPA